MPRRTFPLRTLVIFNLSIVVALFGAHQLYVQFPLAASFAPSYGVLLACTLTVWLLSIFMQDVSIVDIWWGAAFPVQAWCFAVQNLSLSRALLPRQSLLLAVVTLWGGRLAVYLTIRKVREGFVEDSRYMELALPLFKRGLVPPWAVALGALFQIFLLQYCLMCLVGVPLLAVMLTTAEQQELRLLDAVACIVFLIGIVFEAGSDYQLAAFKADSANKGKVLTHGFFHWTRHPNYFGDFLVHVSFYLFACAATAAHVDCNSLTIGSVALMYVMLRYVSGAALLDSCQAKVKPKYKEYILNHSCFFPWPPSAVGKKGS